MKIFIRTVLLLTVSVCATASFAGDKIKVYFNNPVDTSVATGVSARYLPNSTMADTVIAYINRAKYTLDIAMYNYSQTSSFTNIASAVNAAYARGVVVRWICDGSSGNSGLTALNAGIHTVHSPTASNYTIMHNKFFVIDANSADPADAIVQTGSTNWTSGQLNSDFNNMLFLQDAALAQAYTAEFNLMWGSTTAVPNYALAKFGQYKTDLGQHTFNIDGHLVELYFSPSDGVNNKILNTIASANTDLYAGVYTFTESSDANAIVAKKNAGVYTRCIVDQYTESASSSTYNILSNGLGTDGFREYYGAHIYHNKMMIVDPSDKCSDPLVLTGSHNWSVSADTKNDENTLIIHSDTIANIYYQSFYANFTLFSGSMTPQVGCGLAVNNTAPAETEMSVFPNPTDGRVTISYNLPSAQDVEVVIYNILGQVVATIVGNARQQPGGHTYNYRIGKTGTYIVRFTIGNVHFNKRLLVGI